MHPRLSLALGLALVSTLACGGQAPGADDTSSETGGSFSGVGGPGTADDTGTASDTTGAGEGQPIDLAEVEHFIYQVTSYDSFDEGCEGNTSPWPSVPAYVVSYHRADDEYPLIAFVDCADPIECQESHAAGQAGEFPGELFNRIFEQAFDDGSMVGSGTDSFSPADPESGSLCEFWDATDYLTVDAENRLVIDSLSVQASWEPDQGGDCGDASPHLEGQPCSARRVLNAVRVGGV